MGEKTPHTVKFSKFFTSLFSYAGLLGPSLLTLHILNLTLNSDIPIPPMDVSRVEIKEETIEPKFPSIFFPDLKDEEEEGDNEGEEEGGEEGEEEEGENDEDEEDSDPVEESQEPEESEPEEKEEEEENSKEDEGPKFLKEDGKLDYDVVAAWARKALEEYNKNKV